MIGIQLTTHLVNFGLIHLITSPRVTLDLLGVHLPFGKKSNLFAISFGIQIRSCLIVQCEQGCQSFGVL